VPLLRSTPDFRNEAAIADALLNPQDKPYSVPQQFEIIRAAGLQFGRWLRQAPYLPQCGAPASSPHAQLFSRLQAEQQYAAMELFRGTMVRHNAIVFRNDSPGVAQPIRFDGDAWRDYVPIRIPDTICIDERLPPGAAAVLINRTHTFTDIFLPIDRQDKRLFDAIDSERTIGDILGDRANDGTARDFFERLWRYDQLVFDVSSITTGKSDVTDADL
jgi:hypothetical protein